MVLVVQKAETSGPSEPTDLEALHGKSKKLLIFLVITSCLGCTEIKITPHEHYTTELEAFILEKDNAYFTDFTLLLAIVAVMDNFPLCASDYMAAGKMWVLQDHGPRMQRDSPAGLFEFKLVQRLFSIFLYRKE